MCLKYNEDADDDDGGDGDGDYADDDHGDDDGGNDDDDTARSGNHKGTVASSQLTPEAALAILHLDLRMRLRRAGPKWPAQRPQQGECGDRKRDTGRGAGGEEK